VSALARWTEQLEARTIPIPILEAAPESPWGFPPELFRVRADRAATAEPTPTTLRAREALPEGGSVLDVGCGGGATSLPLADRAGLLVGVDGSVGMLATFTEAAEALGVDVRTVEGTWPEAAVSTPVCDVAVCGHVLYNVPDLAPFVLTLGDHAARRVVLEVTDRHPVAWMNDLWRRFHGVTFPDGPTADDAEAAIRELGITVQREDRPATDERHGGFPRREDAVAFARRRLCLTADRDAEVDEALGDRLREVDGLWSAGPHSGHPVVTLWWDPAGRS
jgi:SAM-dependent methyltransferase